MAPAILNYMIVIKFEAIMVFLRLNESDHTRKNISMDIPFYLYR